MWGTNPSTRRNQSVITSLSSAGYVWVAILGVRYNFSTRGNKGVLVATSSWTSWGNKGVSHRLGFALEVLVDVIPPVAAHRVCVSGW